MYVKADGSQVARVALRVPSAALNLNPAEPLPRGDPTLVTSLRRRQGTKRLLQRRMALEPQLDSVTSTTDRTPRLVVLSSSNACRLLLFWGRLSIWKTVYGVFGETESG